MISAVGASTQSSQQIYNNPHNNWITKKTVKSVEIQELVQEQRQFGDCFRENTKQLLPFGAVLTGLWTAIDSAKAPKTIGKSFLSNICSIAPVILAISVVKAYFQSSGNASKK